MPTIPKIPRYLLTAGFIGLAVVLGLSIGYFNIRPTSFNDSLTSQISSWKTIAYSCSTSRVRQLMN